MVLHFFHFVSLIKSMLGNCQVVWRQLFIPIGPFSPYYSYVLWEFGVLSNDFRFLCSIYSNWLVLCCMIFSNCLNNNGYFSLAPFLITEVVEFAGVWFFAKWWLIGTKIQLLCKSFLVSYIWVPAFLKIPTATMGASRGLLSIKGVSHMEIILMQHWSIQWTTHVELMIHWWLQASYLCVSKPQKRKDFRASLLIS